MAGGFGWGDANWWKLVWAHVRILPELLRFGINVLWSDADIIWFKNPSHLFDEFPEVSGAPNRIAQTATVACLLVLRFSFHGLLCNAGCVAFSTQVDLIMGSDHVGTTLQPGEAYFEDPSLALEHTYNSGEVSCMVCPITGRIEHIMQSKCRTWCTATWTLHRTLPNSQHTAHSQASWRCAASRW